MTWEFLLQKKGDKSWLPVESPTVEILSGEYRLASRSSFHHQSIAIQLDYTPTEPEFQPIAQHFNQSVNDEGLLLVLPFTTFTPGHWQITCQNTENFSTTLEFDVQSSLTTDPSTFWLEQMAEEVVNSAMPDFDSEPIAPSPVITAEIATPIVPPIYLATSHFLLNQDNQIQLTGNATITGELQIIVKHPQNLTVLLDRRYAIATPGNFSLNLSLPEFSNSLLLLGEVLWNNAPFQTITFTYPLEQLQKPVAPNPPARPKVELQLPLVRKAVKPMPPQPKEPSFTNGKVAIVASPTLDNNDLSNEFEDIFAPVEGLLDNRQHITPPAAPRAAPPQKQPAPSNQDFTPPPLPSLSLLTQEIQAGNPTILRVTVPKTNTDLAVKVWIKDCQTRTIIDGPRWLLDWQRGSEDWADSYISFPLGRITVTIEAITIDLASRAESRKSYLDCTVIPPNLGERSL